MKETIQSFLESQLHLLNENFVYQQFLMLAGIVLLSFLLKKIVLRLITSLKQHVKVEWVCHVFDIFAAASKAFFAFIFSFSSGQILAVLDYKHHVIDWASSIFVIWFLFRVAQKTLELSFHEEKAMFWSRKVLTPVVLITIMLSSVGLLSTVLDWRLKFENLEFNISLRSILVGLVILFVFIQLGRYLRKILDHNILPQAGAEKAVAHAIATLSFYFIAVLGIIVSLTAMGIDLSSLTVILGGLSVGIGFGLQAIVSNFVSGFILLFEKSIGPGDVIDIAGKTGQVKAIGIRSITILTRDNIELIIPNSYYLTEIVTNLTRSSNDVRLRVNVGVSYGTDPRLVEKALLETCEHPELLMHPKPAVQFVDFADSSLNFQLLVWTTQAKHINIISSDLRYKIFDVFKKYNIEIPFPQQDVHIRSDVRKK
jgi:small-conductance mechanosensitive channel